MIHKCRCIVTKLLGVFVCLHKVIFLYVYMDKYYCTSVFAYIMNSFMPFMKNIRVFASFREVVFLYAYVDKSYLTSVFAYVMNSFRDMSLYGRICMHGHAQVSLHAS